MSANSEISFVSSIATHIHVHVTEELRPVSGADRALFKLDTELAKLAAKTLSCIERVHQRPSLAQVGNQTATLEFDNEDGIARQFVHGK